MAAFLLAATSWSAVVEGRSKMMAPLFSYGFPQTRSGRATPPATPPSAAVDPNQELLSAEVVAPAREESFLDKILDEEQASFSLNANSVNSLFFNGPYPASFPSFGSFHTTNIAQF